MPEVEDVEAAVGEDHPPSRRAQPLALAAHGVPVEPLSRKTHRAPFLLNMPETFRYD